MSGGKTKQTQNTNKTTTSSEQATRGPWAAAEPYITDLYEQALAAFNKTSRDPYTAPLVAGPNADQMKGVNLGRSAAEFANQGQAQQILNLANMTAGGGFMNANSPFATAMAGIPSASSAINSQFTPGQFDLTGPTGSAVNSTLNGDWLNANPHLQGAIDAAIRPVTQTLQRQVLPGLDDQSILQGAYGGSGGDIARGLATSDWSRQAGDISSTMSYNNFNAERDRMNNLAGLMAGIQGQNYTNNNNIIAQQNLQRNDLLAGENNLLRQLTAGNIAAERGHQNNVGQLYAGATNLATMPASLYDLIGGQQQQWDQAALTGELQRYGINQAAPWSGINDFMNLLIAGGFSDSTSSGTSNTQGTTTTTTQQKPSLLTSLIQGAAGVGGLLSGVGAVGGLGGLGSMMGLGSLLRPAAAGPAAMTNGWAGYGG